MQEGGGFFSVFPENTDVPEREGYTGWLSRREARFEAERGNKRNADYQSAQYKEGNEEKSNEKKDK